MTCTRFFGYYVLSACQHRCQVLCQVLCKWAVTAGRVLCGPVLSAVSACKQT